MTKLVTPSGIVALAVFGSLAIAGFAAPADAQGTQTDAAIFAEFKKSCGAHVDKMVATIRSHGESVSADEMYQFFEALPGQLREAAAFGETRADAAFYRAAAANVRAEAAKPNNPDKSAAVSAPSMLCLIDILIAHAAGAPATAPSGRASASAAPAGTPAAPVDADDEEDGPPSSSNPFGCVGLDDAPGRFKNRCPFPVYFTYCGVNPEKDSWIADCNQQKTTGLLGVEARGVQGGFTRAEKVYTFACEKPQTPQDVKFVPGKGLHGSCK